MHKATKKLDKFLDESYDVSEEDEENQVGQEK